MFETALPVDFPWFRNPEPSPNIGETFGQHLEPTGTYCQTLSSGCSKEHLTENGWITGRFSASKPLVIEHKNTGPTGWKLDLSETMDGLTGIKLMMKLKSLRFDAIVTVDSNKGQTREVVVL